jgi:hypothetical protein
MERFDHLSPRGRARITGIVYLLFFVTTILSVIVTGGFTPTASNIVAHEGLFRLGFALGLFSTVCYVALAALFYQLFKHVNRTFALLAAFFSLVGSTITAVQSIFQLAPFVVLGGSYSSQFNAQQLQSLAQMLVDLNTQAGYVALVFFGFFQLAIGYLIFRSGFLPRILGVLIAVAGLGWLTFLFPPLANHVLTYLEVLGVIGELPLMLWLVVMGVNSQRWNDKATAAGLRAT